MTILCFTDTNQEIKRKIHDSSDHIMEHLIKIWIFPNHDTVDHWKREVVGFLNKVPKTKNSKKYPSKEFILKNSWNVYEDILDNIIISAIDEVEDATPIWFDESDIYKGIFEYFDWLSDELSTKGIILRQDAYAKIEEIGDKLFTY